jgi:hypothetical protein
MTQEEVRLSESESRQKHWKRWGPYLSERIDSVFHAGAVVFYSEQALVISFVFRKKELGRTFAIAHGAPSAKITA